MMVTAGPHSTFTFKLECITRREFPSVQYCTGAKREAQATKRNGERKAVRPALRPEESAEMRIRAGAGSAATAAIGKHKTTQGHANFFTCDRRAVN